MCFLIKNLLVDENN
jgi:hypothetical protein